MASSIASFPVSPLSGPDLQLVWPRRQVIPRGASGGADYEASPLESVALYGTRPTPATSPVPKKQGRGSESLMGGNRYVGPVIEAEGEKLMTRTNEKKRDEHRSLDDGKTVEKLDLLWDDGCGSASVKDYLNAVKEIIRPDGGPPRWFCPVECGQPLKGSPILLFLPGTSSCLLHPRVLESLSVRQ